MMEVCRSAMSATIARAREREEGTRPRPKGEEHVRSLHLLYEERVMGGVVQ